ncbi:hypothetical protein SynA1825c_02515 [Synechococcus sp. A18-25c]|nr:hypothetical protein SynA1825c_02515 [Synechococcus sp. A18-25c]
MNFCFQLLCGLSCTRLSVATDQPNFFVSADCGGCWVCVVSSSLSVLIKALAVTPWQLD